MNRWRRPGRRTCAISTRAALYGPGLSQTRLNRFLRGKPRADPVLATRAGRLLRACKPGEGRIALGKFLDVPERNQSWDDGRGSGERPDGGGGHSRPPRGLTCATRA